MKTARRLALVLAFLVAPGTACSADDEPTAEGVGATSTSGTRLEATTTEVEEVERDPDAFLENARYFLDAYGLPVPDEATLLADGDELCRQAAADPRATFALYRGVDEYRFTVLDTAAASLCPDGGLWYLDQQGL